MLNKQVFDSYLICETKTTANTWSPFAQLEDRKKSCTKPHSAVPSYERSATFVDCDVSDMGSCYTT